jgi:uncharacterized protein YndB with AHSA1/START domain
MRWKSSDGSGTEVQTLSIRWPARFEPARAPVHVRNEIEVPAPPGTVWRWLARAVSWPEWYPNASRVEIEGGGSELRAGARFRWSTFGVALSSRVEEFEPPSRLAWTGRGTGVDVYHAWLLTPSDVGCHVETEESQYGTLARLDHALRPRRMARWHQVWLERLRSRSIGGPPATG